MCEWVERHTDRWIDGWLDGQRDERWTWKQTDRLTGTHTDRLMKGWRETGETVMRESRQMNRWTDMFMFHTCG